MLDTARMNTRIPSDVLERLVAANPAKVLDNGNIQLPPARLSYPNLGKKGDSLNPDNTRNIEGGSYGAVLLFTPNANLDAAGLARKSMIAACFPNNPTGEGLKPVFRDQAERVAPSEGGRNVQGKTTSGYVPGCWFLSPNSSNNRPFLSTLINGVVTPFVGSVDEIEAAFYPGCWVIPYVNLFHGKNPKNPNVFFGLQAVVKVMDDNAFQGGISAGDVQKAFEGVDISATMDPSAAFAGIQGQPGSPAPAQAAPAKAAVDLFS